MARLKRLSVPGHPHHITLLGLAGPPVFADDGDHAAYLDLLARFAAEHRVEIHAYALLPGGVQLLATPADANALSLLMQAVGRQYVAAFNRRHGRAGTLWQGRFQGAPLEAAPHLVTCMRYIEQAPVRAGLALHAGDYAWSSASHHLGAAKSALIADHRAFWQLGNTPFEREAAYRRLLQEPLSAAQVRQIEAATLKGWAWGSSSFVAAVSGEAVRRAAPRERGRPRKASEPAA